VKCILKTVSADGSAWSPRERVLFLSISNPKEWLNYSIDLKVGGVHPVAL
jgi:sugar lactone lactonase YvrE